MIKPYKHIKVSVIGTPSASIPPNQREAPLPSGLSRWRSYIAVGHVTKGSWVRFPLEISFFPKKFFHYYKPSFVFKYKLKMVVVFIDFGRAAYLYKSKSLFKRCSLVHCLAEDVCSRNP